MQTSIYSDSMKINIYISFAASLLSCAVFIVMYVLDEGWGGKHISSQSVTG